jgi:hypothetical protein
MNYQDADMTEKLYSVKFYLYNTTDVNNSVLLEESDPIIVNYQT